jgi:nicotinate-nucleotide--dimethylbenzimidazole phosphoribosyltransferase
LAKSRITGIYCCTLHLISKKLGQGTRNMVVGPAMTPDDVGAAITAGIELVAAEVEQGLDLVVTGEMGIANTTAASAIVAAITGHPVAAVAGRGTGLDDRAWARKVAVIERVLAVNRPNPADPLDVLTKAGG